MIIHQRSEIVNGYVIEQINGHDSAVSLPDIFGSKKTSQQYSDSEAFVESDVHSEITMKFSYLISGLIGFLFFSSTVGMFFFALRTFAPKASHVQTFLKL